MIGPILLFLSWVILRLFGRSLSELGLNHPRRRVLEFGGGLALAAAFATGYYLSYGGLGGFSWTVNPGWSFGMGLEALRWDINSVLYEELLFRGVLLYLAIVWLGVRRACALSAVAFGVYHWFSYGVLGALVPMIYVFLITGLSGLMFAYAFVRTGSVVLPVALHLGWNYVNNAVFSNGPLGAGWLIPDPETVPLEGLAMWVHLAVMLALPVLMLTVVLPRLRPPAPSTTSD